MDMTSIGLKMDPLLISKSPKIIKHILLLPLIVEIRAVLTWNIDMVDLELVIKEPNGQTCDSFNNQTKNGGILSRDFSKGYGPVEYTTRYKVKGDYQLFVRLVSPYKNMRPITCRLIVATRFGESILEEEKVITKEIISSDYRKYKLLATVN